MIHRTKPDTVLIRHKLSDGFSDDVISALKLVRSNTVVKIIVLLEAGTPSPTEVRQLALGADCVLRDPVRTDVLVAYIGKYVKTRRNSRRAGNGGEEATSVSFAGGRLHAAERTLRNRRRIAHLTPREVTLVELLAHSGGELLTYENLYSDILGRSFRGDTSNMRVLLGKLTASLQPIGIAVRRWVEVVPKTGYRYKLPEM
jgi:DNA-binding response OmpR family regulator